MTTPLAEKLKRVIAEVGPISLADYFNACLNDPEHGYYRTRQPFGESGDFITAPEISQLFGEIVGVFLVNAWAEHGRPQKPLIVEIGPGRGALMADVLRVAASLAPQLAESAAVHLVETSPTLAGLQRRSLGSAPIRPTWHADIDTVPAGFTLLLANELFDALPIRQFAKSGDGFRERVVTVDSGGALSLALGPARLPASALPPGAGRQPEGTVVEIAPARDGLMIRLAERLVRDGGTGLIIDYGHAELGFGDTLQAVRRHRFDPPLAHPGEADLTSHVDFARLAAAARSAGAAVNGLVPQGDFLIRLGLLERAGQLGRGRQQSVQDSLRQAVERLAGDGPGQMGALFKVMAVSGRPIDLPPFCG